MSRFQGSSIQALSRSWELMPLFPGGFGTHSLLSPWQGPPMPPCSDICFSPTPPPSLTIPSWRARVAAGFLERGRPGVSGGGCAIAVCSNSSAARGREQNKAPFVAGSRPVPTEGLGRLRLTPVGAGEPVGSTAPRWLWKQHDARGVLLQRR